MQANMTDMASPHAVWQAETTVPKSAAALFEEAFAAADAVSSAPAGNAHLCLRAVYGTKPDRSVLEASLALAAAAAGVPAPALSVAPLEDRDWVAEGLKHLEAVTVGRVRVRGDHLAPAPGAGRIELVVAASTAFGTGHHETTTGCLAALQRVLRRQRVARALDMGCGTGVLAMALARLGVPRVLAADIDPVAVTVAADNARANRIGARLRTVLAGGYDARAVRAAAPFDLVVANILARPLVAMAPALAGVLAPGGVAILSGLLEHQQRLVLNAHRASGLRLRARRVQNGWATLTVVKPGSVTLTGAASRPAPGREE